MSHHGPPSWVSKENEALAWSEHEQEWARDNRKIDDLQKENESLKKQVEGLQIRIAQLEEELKRAKAENK